MLDSGRLPGATALASAPTIVLKDGQPIIALGAAGGPKIISAVLQELVELLDLNHTPAEAVAAPRIHQQWSPDELLVEPSLSLELQKSLAGSGQKIKVGKIGSTSHIVARSADGKSFIGAADPRSDGTAAGW